MGILIAAFSFSMIIAQIVNVDWELLPRISPPPPFFGAFRVLPYFWIFVSILIFVFVYFDFRNTRKGYRYGGGMIVGISLLVALVFGTGIYFLGASRRADEFFIKNPIYKMMHPGHRMMWNVPEKGVLAGSVLEINEEKALIMEDFSNKIWMVDISNAKISKRVEIFVGANLKVLGKSNAPGEFFAEEIKPF